MRKTIGIFTLLLAIFLLTGLLESNLFRKSRIFLTVETSLIWLSGRAYLEFLLLVFVL